MENLIFRHGRIFLASAGNREKQQKVATPLLFDHSEQACLVLYPETKYQHETTKSKGI